jgi:hypothetical protein
MIAITAINARNYNIDIAYITTQQISLTTLLALP